MRRLLPDVREEEIEDTPGSRLRENTPVSEGDSYAEAQFQVSDSFIIIITITQHHVQTELQVSGSVLDLHAGQQPMDLVVLNVKKVFNIPVSI